LQEAFESLSIADKCALSVSLGRSQHFLQKLHDSNEKSKLNAENGNQSFTTSTSTSSFVNNETDINKLLSNHELPRRCSFNSESSTSDQLSSYLNEDLEIQSVLSDLSCNERDYLDSFISLMGPRELANLEEEVILIIFYFLRYHNSQSKYINTIFSFLYNNY
jgi:hypothetical protein